MSDYQVLITEIAQQEIIAIGHYINDKFKSPDTARKTMFNIVKGANRLSYSADGFPFVKNRFEVSITINISCPTNNTLHYFISINLKRQSTSRMF
ncbi:hypothetical protein Hs20B_06110 [Lactococcus insecticola]|uniref:Uncharacterized protein n=1 Tax=Pseudolactococcus insecticola TaxID=2709158 RepID=A0A6A0B6B5_9LACT|nr:hypothetical protein Hs20B_06110 [Lactococcus insecticola]